MESENGFEAMVEKYKVPFALGLVGVVLIIGGAFSSGIFKSFSKSVDSAKKVSSSEVSPMVDISGAVTKPGVYALQPGARISEAIEVAGGLSESADPTFLAKNINLAQKVSDGMKIYIPASGEAVTANPNNKGGATGVLGASSAISGGMVNINDASAAQLDSLPGIGPVTAQNIIDKRPYADVGDLLSKKVVTRSTFAKIKDLITAD